MEKIKAIIVDDEERARRVLSNLLAKTDESIDIVAECSSVQEAVEAIKKEGPDVVFLDVQMPNYSGYEIVDFIDKINFEIIFVTAFDQYAIKAFEICAIDYLLKPIDRNRLIASLAKLKSILNKSNKIEQYQTLLESLKGNEFRKIVIPELGNRRIVELKNIVAVQANGAYSDILLKDESRFITSKNLKYFEDIISNSKDFMRVHRSWIINLSYIENMNRTEGNIYLSHGVIAKISRNKYDEFDQLVLR